MIGVCWCNNYESSGVPCPPGKCPNVPKPEETAGAAAGTAVLEHVSDEAVVKEMFERLSKPDRYDPLQPITKRVLLGIYRETRQLRASELRAAAERLRGLIARIEEIEALLGAPKPPTESD